MCTDRTNTPMMLTVIDVRHAFERDMVRRLGRKAFKQQPMEDGSCVMCAEVFRRPAWNVITCSTECARLNKNEKERQRYHANHS